VPEDDIKLPRISVSPQLADQNRKLGQQLKGLGRKDAARAPTAQVEHRSKPKGESWTTDIAKQLKAENAIPEDATQDDLAGLIVQRMQEQAGADPSSRRPLTSGYIRSRLSSWKLWPVCRI
jgi:hypothetical protein